MKLYGDNVGWGDFPCPWCEKEISITRTDEEHLADCDGDAVCPECGEKIDVYCRLTWSAGKRR
jgi:hypothetical protein